MSKEKIVTTSRVVIAQSRASERLKKAYAAGFSYASFGAGTQTVLPKGLTILAGANVAKKR